jgi:signal transduction histidine kinase
LTDFMSQSYAQFSARARVVDLLGRQQIADVPTAMGELFKNAIDAGASAIRLDYWPEYGCFSAADNGLGMRREEDLLNRWMVLATDSKHGQPSPEWTLYATKEQENSLRTQKAFGEKGIGRLAMALLGVGTLVWTRWGSGDNIQRTLLLVPWTVFRHAALTLDQIRLPMLSLDRDATNEDAVSLVAQLEKWFLEDLKQAVSVPPELERELILDFTAFRKALKAPLKFPSEMGTSFTVLGVSEILISHFDGWLVKKELFEDDLSKDSDGRESYLAFSNKFLPGKNRLDISLFESGREYSLADENFWKPEDFDNADHLIEAEIDENGFALVNLRMKGNWAHHETQLSPLPRRSRSSGKLRFKLGYVEGDLKNSSLPQEDWQAYTKRLERFGGLFVYMNDIRVQPYGRANEDFLEFEKRRSLNAGRYFFSHRRMFGGLFLSHLENSALVEKAGREGFQQTGAYRGMIFWLRTLFVELADTYFGRNAGRADKAERADEKRRKQREEREAEAKKDYETELNRSRQRVEPTFKKFKERFEPFHLYLRTIGEKPTESQIAELQKLIAGIRSSYEGLWAGFILGFPFQYTPEPRQVEVIDSYLHAKQVKDDEARAMLADAAGIVERLAEKAKPAEETKKSRADLLNEHRQQLERILNAAAAPAADAAGKLRNSISERVRVFIEELTTSAEASSPKLDESATTLEEAMSREKRAAQERAEIHFGNLTLWLNALASGDESVLDVHDLREEIRLLRERESRLLELAQLGLVIESVDHDYHAMLGNIDKALVDVKQAFPDSESAALATLITGIEHLDERLQFWDPLVRRGSGVVSDLTGEDVRKFIQGVMDQHSRQNVKMEYTPKFLACPIVDVKRSSFLGAVHNLVMNAGYWCTKNAESGAVRFSMHEEGIIVSDSGPGITERDRRHIFEPGFSRRPSGRGLGLYIARSTLYSFGCGLRLLETPAAGALPGANFLITLLSRNKK